MYNKTSQPPEPYFGSVGGRVCRGRRIWSPNIWGTSLLRAEFVRGRVCKGPRCPRIVLITEIWIQFLCLYLQILVTRFGPGH